MRRWGRPNRAEDRAALAEREQALGLFDPPPTDTPPTPIPTPLADAEAAMRDAYAHWCAVEAQGLDDDILNAAARAYHAALVAYTRLAGPRCDLASAEALARLDTDDPEGATPC